MSGPMAPPSEPVGTGQCRPEIDEKPRRYGKTKNEVEHDQPPSKPRKRADAQHQRREPDRAEREIDDVEHGRSPCCPDGTGIACAGVKPLFAKHRVRVRKS